MGRCLRIIGLVLAGGGGMAREQERRGTDTSLSLLVRAIRLWVARGQCLYRRRGQQRNAFTYCASRKTKVMLIPEIQQDSAAVRKKLD